MLYSLIYKDGKKFITKEITNLLTARALAFWLQDDASWSTSKKTVIISSHSFSHKECKLLCLALKSNLNLIAMPNKDIRLKNGSQSYVIRFSSNSDNIEKLRALMIEHFHPSMLYKLGL